MPKSLEDLVRLAERRYDVGTEAGCRDAFTWIKWMRANDPDWRDATACSVEFWARRRRMDPEELRRQIDEFIARGDQP